MRYKGLFFLVAVCCTLAWTGCREEIPAPPKNEPQVATFTLIEDEVGGESVVVVGSESYNLVVSFYTQLGTGESMQFTRTQEELPAIMEDTEGNLWNVFGEAIRGPRLGQRLITPPSFMVYWFAISSQYPGMEIFQGPSSAASPIPLNDPDWNIPTSSIAWGSAWDAIQSLDYPNYIEFKARDYLEDGYLMEANSLVSGLRINGETKAFPHLILNWHEIINDRIGEQEISLAWCPLVGTATVWSREENPAKFSVSGLLHNNNLVMFDRDTESIWSQIRGECVYGDRRNELATSVQMVETSWSTWQRIVEDPIVLSEETGIARDYAEDDFEFYRNTENYLFYPIDHQDTRLPEKERVHTVIINGEAKAYRFSSFDS